MSTPAANVGRKVAIAATYAILQRVILRGIGFISTLVMVRLLSPEDFGIVGLAGAVVYTVEVLTQTGFGAAIIRMKEPRDEHYNTAFTLGLGRGVILSLLLLLLAGAQAELVNDPRVGTVVTVLAISPILASFESPRMVDLQRELRFDVLLRYVLVQKLTTFVLSLVLVIVFKNYWGLVLCGPLSRIVTMPYSYYLAPTRPRLTLSAWRDLFHFSKWLMLSNVCVMVESQIMNFVIGRFQGLAAVGLYQVAQQIALLPISEIASPIRTPIYAGFAKIYHEIDTLRRQFLLGLELQWLALVPMAVGISLISRELTTLFLGEKWSDAIPLIPLVALYGLFDSFGVNTFSVFQVLNRQAKMVITYFILIFVRVAAVIYGSYEYGVLGAASAMLATAMLNTTLWQLQVGELLKMRLTDLLHVLWRGTVATLAMSVVVLLVPDDVAARLGLHFAPVVMALMLKSALGALTYISVLLLLWQAAGAPPQAAEVQVMNWLGAVVSRLRSSVLRTS